MLNTSILSAGSVCDPTYKEFSECLLESVANRDPIVVEQQPEWEDMYPQFFFGCGVNIVLLLIAKPMERLYASKFKQFSRWLKSSLGVTGISSNTWIRAASYQLQLACSTFIVVTWISKTYDLKSTGLCLAESVIGAVLLLLYLLEWVIADLSFAFVAEIFSMLDLFTALPLVAQTLHCFHDVNCAYLRVFMLSKAWFKLRALTDMLDSLSTIHRSLLDLTVQIIVCLTFFAGTMYNLETLGDFHWLQDNFTRVGSDSLSFFQMTYFTLVTISTVGYGDFAPRSVLGRLFAFVIIAGGVTFFSIQLGELAGLFEREKAGLGRYTSKRRRHVVVTGGAVHACSVEVLSGFIRQICSAEAGEQAIPHVVLLGSRSINADTLPILGDPLVGQYVTSLVGSVFVTDDMERVALGRASFCYILADPWTNDESREDEENVLMMAHILRHFPEIPYKFMLFKPENSVVASQMGLDMTKVHSVRDCLHMLTVPSCRCPGLSTLLLNLISGTTIQEHNEFERLLQVLPDTPKWILDFWNGCAQSVRIAVLGSKHSGKQFQDLQVDLYSETGLVLIGVGGRSGILTLNPIGWELEEGDCVYIIGSKQKCTDFIEKQDIRQTPPTFTLGQFDAVSSLMFDDINSGLDELEIPEFDEMETRSSLPNSRGTTRAKGAMKTGKRVKTKSGLFGMSPAMQMVQLAANTPVTGSVKEIPQEMDERGRTWHVDIPQTYEEDPISSSQNPEFLEVSAKGSSNADHHVDGQGVTANKKILLASPSNMIRDLAGTFSAAGVKMKGHLVVVVTDSGNTETQIDWTVVFSQVRKLRQDPLNKWKTIFVICCHAVPRHLVMKFDKVVGVVGNPRSHRHFKTVSLQYASAVLLITGKAPNLSTEDALQDRCQIVIRGMIDSYLQATCKTKYRPQIIIELHRWGSVRSMPLYSAAEGPTGSKLISVHDKQQMMALRRSFSQTPRAKFSTFPNRKLLMGSSVEMTEEDRSLVRAFTRVAAGEIIPRAALASFFAYSFYNPGTLNMLSALAQSPGKGSSDPETSASMQTFRIPLPWLELTYGRLFHKLKSEGVILLGLFRPPGTLGSQMSFVSTNPPEQTKLVLMDKAFVIASPKWIATSMALMNPQVSMAATRIQRWLRRVNARVEEEAGAHHEFLSHAISI